MLTAKYTARHSWALCLFSSCSCFINPSAKLSSAPEAGVLLSGAQLDFLREYADKPGTLSLCPQQCRNELADLVFLTTKELFYNSLLLDCLSLGFSCLLAVSFFSNLLWKIFLSPLSISLVLFLAATIHYLTSFCIFFLLFSFSFVKKIEGNLVMYPQHAMLLLAFHFLVPRTVPCIW